MSTTQALSIPSMTPRKWRLADHVRASLVDGQVILLDLKRNQYLGVGGPTALLLSMVIDDWPAMGSGAPAPTERPGTAESSAAALLLARGLVTDTPCGSRERRTVPDVTQSLQVDPDPPNAPASWHQAWLLARCAMGAGFVLRMRSLESIASMMAARQRRATRQRAVPPSPDELRAAIARYRHLRPLLFSSRDRCLHDSLTLLAFLLAQGIRAHWVIGVQVRPFGAHSWVQDGTTVLNDEPERVRKFRPILVV